MCVCVCLFYGNLFTARKSFREVLTFNIMYCEYWIKLYAISFSITLSISFYISTSISIYGSLVRCDFELHRTNNTNTIMWMKISVKHVEYWDRDYNVISAHLATIFMSIKFVELGLVLSACPLKFIHTSHGTVKRLDQIRSMWK